MPYKAQDAVHYETTKQVFRHSAIYAQGYYDAQPGKRLKHSIWQLRVRNIVRSLLDPYLQRRPGVTRVIDVGCGKGDLCIELATRYPQLTEVWGADFSHEMLTLAWAGAKPLKHVFFREADVLAMPFEDSSFDGTLCINVLHHIHAADFKRGLAELTRITSRCLVIEIKNRRCPYYRYIHSRNVQPLGRVSIFPTSTPEVSTVLRDYGFQLTAERGIFGIEWLSPIVVLLYEREP